MHITLWIADTWPVQKVDPKGLRQLFVEETSVLFTWCGEFGVFPDYGSVKRTYQKVTKMPRQRPTAHKLWRALSNHCQGQADLLGARVSLSPVLPSPKSREAAACV